MTECSPPRGVVGVVRTDRADQAVTLGRGWLLAGVPGIEVTTTVPDAATVIAELAPDSAGRVGAGTVLTPDQAEMCVRAGAAYLVAPNLDPDVLARAAELCVPFVPGTLTPSEMVAAARAGAAAVKVFPVTAVGGLDYVRAVREPLPQLRIVASGGITVGEVSAYLHAGAYSVCLGKALTDQDAVERGDIGAVARYASGVLARCAGAPITSAG